MTRVPMMSKSVLKAHIRWTVRRDFPAIARIESANYPAVLAWTEQQFIELSRQRNVILLTAEVAGVVVGYVAYEMRKGLLELLNIGVSPMYVRRGIGAQLLQRLKEKVKSSNRSRAALFVRETNLAAQLFFRSQGYLGVAVDRSHYAVDYDDEGMVAAYVAAGISLEEDGFRMVLSVTD